MPPNLYPGQNGSSTFSSKQRYNNMSRSWIFIQVLIQGGPAFSHPTCSSVDGQGGSCGHVCALLYTLALWKGQGKTTPDWCGKTSLQSKMGSSTMKEVEVSNATKVFDSDSGPSRPIRSNLYDPTHGNDPDWKSLCAQLKEGNSNLLVMPVLGIASVKFKRNLAINHEEAFCHSNSLWITIWSQMCKIV